MIKKAAAAMSLLQKGKRVNNVEAWKTGQVSVEAVSGVIGAALTAFILFTGSEIQVGEQELDTIASALVTLVPTLVGLWGAISTVITTNKIGLQGDRGTGAEGTGED